MSFPFGDLRREISGPMFRPNDVSINVDSLDKFTMALSKAVDLKPAEKKIEGIASCQFCGVKVVANDLVPTGMAVILHGNEIVNIIRYAS